MFVAIPAELSSFREELVYEYSQNESDDLLFEIELGEDSESREVKKLYNTSSATINIAPIVANAFMSSPASGETGIETPQCGYGLVSLSCGEYSTEPRYFVAAKGELPEEGVVSTIPTKRVISFAEADEVWIRAQEGSLVSVELAVSDELGESTYLFEHTAEECGFVRFRFNTLDFSPSAMTAQVRVVCGGQEEEVITYTYIPRVRGAVRLAWIGYMGSVEHYTFPASTSVKIMKGGVRRYEVVSNYESHWVVEALSEIISSPKVWMVEGDDYHEVHLLSEFVELSKNGELSSVEYKFERYD